MVALNTRKISPDNVHLKYGDDNWKKNHQQYGTRARFREKYSNRKISRNITKRYFSLNRDFLRRNCLKAILIASV